jgi:hypothetical protein
MAHIAQTKLDSTQWIQYQSWFWVRNFGPKDFIYENNTLTLLNGQVIAEFVTHHPNLPFETVQPE